MLPFLSGSVFWVKSSGRNPRPDGPSTHYEYQLSGTMRYPITYYEVDRDSTGTVRIAWSESNEPDIRVIKGPEDFFQRVDGYVAQYKLHKLKNRYLPRMQVLDGEMWYARIRFTENSILSNVVINSGAQVELDNGNASDIAVHAGGSLKLYHYGNASAGNVISMLLSPDGNTAAPSGV